MRTAKTMAPISIEQAKALPQRKGAPLTDAQIRAQIDADTDVAPLLSAIDLTGATLIRPEGKASLTIRLDVDVIEAYKSTGKGWQTRINDTLRAGITAETLRFSARQVDALEQYARACTRSAWAEVGVDLGQDAVAMRIAGRLKAVLAGQSMKFTKDDLLFLAETSSSLIELSTPLLAHPMVTESAKRNAQWQNVIGRDLRDLASLIRSELQRSAK